MRPGMVRSFVTEFDGSGQINPTPATAKHSDLLSVTYLSPEKLVSAKSQVTIKLSMKRPSTKIFLLLPYRKPCLGLMIYSKSQAWRFVLTPSKRTWRTLVRLMNSLL